MNNQRQIDHQALKAWTPTTYAAGVTEIIWGDIPWNIIARINGFVPLAKGAQISCDNSPPVGTFEGQESIVDVTEVWATLLDLRQGGSKLQYYVS